ncbi:MAG: OsmC family protein [Bacteroidales bacterium]|nr:OsmC family protein [Bacteroidales bacterium]
MENYQTTYMGELRTQITHDRNNQRITTDAPVDNKGQGEYFSPTDMVSSALCSCIFTIMGIKARENGFTIDGASATTTKVMRNDPRRIAEIRIEYDFTGHDLNQEQKDLLRELVHASPVPRSLHPDIKQDVKLKFKA